MSAYRSFFVSAKAERFSINESGQLWSLLAKITLRKLYRTAAFHSAEKRDLNSEAELSDSIVLEEWLVGHEPTPDEAVALVDELETLLESLRPQSRRMVELRLQGELLEDIALEVGVSERTVRRTLRSIEVDVCSEHGFDLSSADEPNVWPILKPTTVSQPPAIPTSKQEWKFENQIRIQDIVLRRLIGKGGAGKVYSAEHKTTSQSLAVKFLHKNFQDDAASVERFLNEAQTIARLDHSGIVGLKGVGRTKTGVYFFAMPLIDGQSLDQFKLPLRWTQVVVWMIELADALQHAHDAGVIHCDLKPSNIMIDSGNRLVLTDFGLARMLSGSNLQSRTLAGTAPWMAPEQVDEYFGGIGPSTDVYGTGAVLYTLLCGVPPFTGNRTPDVLSQIVSATTMPDPSAFRPDLPPALDEICRQCLNRTPLERPESVADVAVMLRQLLTGEDYRQL